MLKKADAPMGRIGESGLGKGRIDHRRVMRKQGMRQLLTLLPEGIQTAAEQEEFQYAQDVSLVMIRENNPALTAQHAMSLPETPFHVTNMLEDADEQDAVKNVVPKRKVTDVSGET
jgi:hypothetical protein